MSLGLGLEAIQTAAELVQLLVVAGAQVRVAAEQAALEHVLSAAQELELTAALVQIGVIVRLQLLRALTFHELAGHAVHGLEIALSTLGHLALQIFGGGGQMLAHLLLELVELFGTVGELNGAADGENVVHEIDAEEEGGGGIAMQCVAEGSALQMIFSLAFLVGWILSLVGFHKLSKAFGKGIGFTIGMVLLPGIFRIILGFGKAQYVGNSSVTEQK